MRDLYLKLTKKNLNRYFKIAKLHNGTECLFIRKEKLFLRNNVPIEKKKKTLQRAKISVKFKMSTS